MTDDQDMADEESEPSPPSMVRIKRSLEREPTDSTGGSSFA